MRSIKWPKKQLLKATRRAEKALGCCPGCFVDLSIEHARFESRRWLQGQMHPLIDSDRQEDDIQQIERSLQGTDQIRQEDPKALTCEDDRSKTNDAGSIDQALSFDGQGIEPLGHTREVIKE